MRRRARSSSVIGACRRGHRARPGRAALEIFEGLAAGDVRAVWIIVHQSGRLHARPRPDREGAAPGRAGRRPGRVPSDRDHALRRRAATRRPVAGEGRRDDQLRAEADLSSEARGTAGRGAARRGDHRPVAAEMGWRGRSPTRARPRSSTSSSRSPRAAVRLLGRQPRAAGRRGAAQWPIPRRPSRHRAALHRRPLRRRRDGRARFILVEHAEPWSPPTSSSRSSSPPGRVRDHWHTLTRTGKAPALMRRTPEPLLEVNARDARARRAPGRRLRGDHLAAGQGRRAVPVSDTIRVGTCFLPFHWGRGFGFYKSANNLTLSGGIRSRASRSSRPARSGSGGCP